MCQLDGAMGCSDIWLNIILGMSVNTFPDEIDISVGRLSNQMALPLRAGFTQSMEGLDRRKAEKGRIGPLPDFELGHSSSSAF